ncbi:hypothetical protein KY366_07240 [Candidatus Woesearchaeota archaeon]|nr:hypothetical protein [Candidatus Woesearchaeota archaeon]
MEAIISLGTLLKRIEQNSGIVLISSIILGILFSKYTRLMAPYIMYLLMGILFIIFLKIDIGEILSHVKRPLLLSYILLMNLIITPLIVYLLVMPFRKDLVFGALLLASLPTGTAASAITEIIEGRTSLTLILTILSTFLAMATIPSLFYFLLRTQINLDYLAMSLTLAKLILIPLFLAQVAKLLFRNPINKSKKHFGGITVMLVAMIAMSVVGKEANYIFSNPRELIFYTLMLYFLFALFQIIGYFMVFWLKKDEKIAVSASKAVMNNTLGIVLAASFFSSGVTLFLVLTELPWITMPVIFKSLKRYFP